MGRFERLRQLLSERVLVLGSGIGTAVQARDLQAQDFGGETYEGCNEYLAITRPKLLREIHDEHAQAGADILVTNTFGGTPMVLDEFDLGARTNEINRAATQIAREVADARSTPDRTLFVAGSIGPTTKAITVTGGISFDDLVEQFYQQALPLIEGGSDYLLVETSQDTRNIKAALLAIARARRKLSSSIPVAISGTIEPMGTMLAGQSVEALLTSVLHEDLLYLGLNCATGPEFMTDHIRTLAALSPYPVSCVPNAGLPDEDGCYLETPDMVGAVLDRFLKQGWLNVIGGCCGTHTGHIKKMVEIARDASPHVPSPWKRSALSGVDYLEITDEMRPVIVGERTNVIGSRKFKRLLCEGAIDEASEIARAQIKKGAQIVDICVANPDRDELEDMRTFLETTIKKIRVPLMIDSTDAKVIELALTYSQGKAIINSVNLEDGEDRFEQVCPLAQKFGAALVVGTIDDDPEQGMGVSRQRKLEIAERSFTLLTQKYGIRAEDIYWDPLVFPCATGDAQYVGSAVETIEGVRLIKERYPQTKTVLGISNVSFGLPPAGREVLNAVFLYHCVQAGLDMAIVNSEKLERYAQIPEKERQIAEDLLYNRGADPVQTFADHFRDKKPKASKSDRAKIPLDERLAGYIIEGSKDGLTEDLDLKMKSMAPLQIINGPLMKGMDKVGQLFNDNKLIVAEVLQSAEAMKAAVAHLEPHMEKHEDNSRGKIILATVKGDVHDIGKNLVEIILTNNGFKVVNLGIKVPPQTLIEAIRKENPDVVGLSGLLVKSAHQMVSTAEDFSKSGVKTPMLVGGAALSEKFVNQRIADAYDGTVVYASDAMKGLDLAKTITEPERFTKFQKSLKKKQDEAKNARPAKTEKRMLEVPATRSSTIRDLTSEDLPLPTDFERHVIRNTPIEHIWNYVNPLMLYGRHLGIKGGVVRKLNEARKKPALFKELQGTEPRALEIWNEVESVKAEYRGREEMRPAAVYRFFRAHGEGNSIMIRHENRVHELALPRQKKQNGLCLSDYLGRKSESDSLAFFVTTVGVSVRTEAERLKEAGEYLKSHIIQALAIESAEAYAELLHSQIRKIWGFADPPDMTMMQRFQAKYRGKRYSFGYPACPRLDDQSLLFQFLGPAEIGVQLTDGFMMDPEASVSALAFHHPDATYYSVGQVDDNRVG